MNHPGDTPPRPMRHRASADHRATTTGTGPTDGTGTTTEDDRGPTSGPAPAPDASARRRQVVRAPDRHPALRPFELASEDALRDDEYGRTLVASLMRAQLGATLGMLVPALVVLALYPLLATALPAVAAARPFGVPLALVVLGGGIYPPLVGLGFWYVRRAERVERRFAELVDGAEDRRSPAPARAPARSWPRRRRHRSGTHR